MFHDGSPMTADDVVYSYKRIIDAKNPKMGATQLSALKPSGIKKIDASTVQFNLDSPNSVFDEAMAVYGNTIVPVGFNPKQPIGTGPFKLTSFSPGQQIVFAANTAYWGEKPHVDKLTIIEFADPTARVNALLGGTVDAISDLPSSQVKVVQAQGMKVLDAHTGAWQPFTMRIDVKPFNDVRVRQAFRLMIDRKAMIDQAYDGYGWVGNDMYAPFDPGTPTNLRAAPTGPRAGEVAPQGGRLQQRPERHPDDLGRGRRLGGRRRPGLRPAGQGRRRHRQGEQGRLEHLLRRPVPHVAVRPGLLVHAQLPGTDGAGHACLRRPSTRRTGRTPSGSSIVQQAFKTGDKTARDQLVAQAQTIEYNQGGLIVWAFNDQTDAYSSKVGGVVPDKGGVPLSSFHFNKFYFV